MAKKIGDYSIGIKYEVDQASMDKLQHQLMQIQAKAQTAKPGNALYQDLQKAGQSAEKLGEILELSFNKDLGTVNISKFNQLLQQSGMTAQSLAKDFSVAGASGAAAFSKVTSMVMNTQLQIKQSSKLLTSMYETITNTVKWGVASSMLRTFTGTIQKASGYVKDLDSSLNDIRIVTGKSADDMERFAVQANKAAKALGQTTTAYTKASLIYYQQGLGDTEAQARADVTLKAANVTGQSTSDVSEQLTAVWNGYKVSSEEAELYIDRLAAVAANSASNLEELSVGMSKVASAANAMGVGEEQLAAQISTIISTTRQAPESVGTALKTIYARMSDIKMGNEEAEITLGNYTKKMADMGVNVLDANNQLRDMGEVIEEIGGKWASMSKEQQVALAQTMAGTRQYNNLIALFDNWDQYAKMMDIASDAQGTLQKQQDTYMESTAAHLKQQKAAWEGLYASIFKTKEMNNLIDLGTNLVEVFNNFFNAFGGGAKSLVAFGAIAANIFSKNITQSIIKARTEQQAFQNSLDVAKAKNNFSQAFVANYGDKSNWNRYDAATQGNLAQTEKEIELYKQIHSLEGLISEEQYNQLTAMQKQNAELEGELAKEKALQEQAKNNILKGLPKGVNAIGKRSAATTELYTNKIRNDNFEQWEVEEENLKEQEVFLQRIEEIYNKIATIRKSNKNISGEEILNEKQIVALLDKINSQERMVVENKIKNNKFDTQTLSNLKFDVKELKKLNREQQKYLEATREIYRLQQQKTTNDKQWENAKAQVTNTAALAAGANAAISSMSTLASSIGMVTSAVQVLNNEDLNFFQKLTQLLMTSGFLIPSLINSFSGLKNSVTQLAVAFGALESVEEISNLRKAQSIALNLDNEATIDGNTVAELRKLGVDIAENEQLKKGTILTQIDTQLKEKNTLAIIKNTLTTAKKRLVDELDNKEKSKSILLLGLQTIGLAALQLAEVAATLVTEGLSAAWQSLTTAMKTNPFGLILVALSAVITAIVAITKTVISTQEKARQELYENAKAIKEEVDKIRELESAYEDLYKVYKENIDNKQELLDKSLELADALDNEELRVLALAGRWSEYEQEMKEAIKAQKELELVAYQDSLKASEKAAHSKHIGNMWRDFFLEELGMATPAGIAFGIAQFNTLKRGDVRKSARKNILTDKEKNASQEENDFYSRLADNNEYYKISENSTNNTRNIDYDIGNSEKLYKVYQEAQKSYNEASVKGYGDAKIWQYTKKQILDKYKDDIQEYEENVKNAIQSETDLFIIGLQEDNDTPQTLEDFKQQREILFNQLRDNETYAGFSDEQIYAQINKVFQNRNDEFGEFAKEFTIEEGNREADELLVIDALTGYKGDSSISMLSDDKTQVELTEQAKKNVNALTDVLKDIGFEGSLKDMHIEADEWENILNPSGAFDAIDTAEDLINRHLQEVKKAFEKENAETVSNDATALLKGLQTGELNSENIEENDSYKSLQEKLLQIKQLYPDLRYEVELLNSEWAIGSEEYLVALNNVEEKMRELAMDNLYEEAGDALDKVSEELDKAAVPGAQIEIDALLETKEFQDAMDNLLDKDYAIDVEVHAQAEDDFEESLNTMKQMEDMASKIGEGYIVAAEDIRELNNVFPGILENAENLADGTIQLDENIVQSAMNAAQQEVEIDKNKTIEKIKTDIAVAQHRKETYHRMGEIAKNAAETESGYSEALHQIETIYEEEGMANSAEADNQKIKNSETVAKSNYEAADESLKAWSEAYKEQQEDAINWGKANAAAYNAATTGELDTSKLKTIEVKGVSQYSTGSYEDLEAAEALIENDSTFNAKEYMAQLAEKYFSLENAEDAYITDMQGMVAELEASYNKSASSLTSSKNSSKEQDFIDYLKDERDRYHDINIAIKQVENSLEKLSALQDKLMGKALVQNLMAQTEQLQKQVLLTKDKLKIEQQEANTLKIALSAEGVTFNDDGTISNYGTLLADKLDYINSLTEKYNQLSADEQEKFKGTIEAAQASYELLQDNISRYDELVSEEMPELEQKVQDLTNQKIDLQIESFGIEIQTKLDLGEAQRQWNQFLQDVVYKNDKASGNAQRKASDLLTYYNPETEAGVISAETKRVNELLTELREMEETGLSTVYGDNKSKLLEDLKSANDQLMSDMTEFESLIKEVNEDFLSAIDDVAETFENLNKEYEQTSSLIQHDMKLIKSLYDNNYQAMAAYYDKQNINNEKQLSAQKEQVDYWRALMDKEEKGSDAWEKYKEQWEEAVNTLNSTVETSIENLLSSYQNAIDKIMADMNNRLTGGLGLNYSNEEWDLINKKSEVYLDNIESAYETSQLQAKYMKSINDSTSVSIQKKLNDLMNSELKMLKDKDKLTKYDIERANARYDLALKEIALQEAQQNKTQMRLRRDSQGNYSYQYVANEAETQDAQDEYDKSLNNLYKMDKDQYKSSLDEIYSYYKEWQDKMAEAALIKDEEERERLYSLYNDYYGGIINSLVEENEVAKQNLYESTEMSLEEYYQENVQAFQSMTDAEKQAWMGEEGLVPQMISTVASLVDAFADSSSGLPYITESLMGELRAATEKYQEELSTLEEVAGQNFEKIASGIDENIEEMSELVEVVQEHIEEQKQELELTQIIKQKVDTLANAYEKVKGVSVAAATAAETMWEAQMNNVEELTSYITDMIHQINNMVSTFKDAWREAQSTASYYQKVTNQNTSSSNSGSSPGGLGDEATEKKVVINKVGNDGYVLTLDGKVYFNTSGGGTEQQIVDYLYKKIYPNNKNEAQSLFDKITKKGKSGGQEIVKFDTGGYTGDWNNNNGKLAMLHQKEIVLNQQDTQNILTAVNTVRNISGLLQALENSALSRIEAMGSIKSIGTNGIIDKNNVVQQQVHIDAEFKDVRNSKDIQDALTNLVNTASQYAFNTGR